MKPKPPAKKARLDIPGSSGDGAESKMPKTKVIIKQEKLDPLPKAATATTASELLAAVKLAAAAAAQSPGARLTYPQLQYPDMPKEYPRMAYVISASASKAPETVQIMPIDDVDALQYELESLWTAVMVRIRTLEAENEVLESTLLGSTFLGDHYDAHHQEKINAVKSFIDSGHGTRTSVTAAAKLVMCVESPPEVVVPIPTQSPVAGSSRKSNNSAAAATSGPPPTLLNSNARQPKKKLKAEMGGKVKLGGNKPARAGQNRSHSMSMDDSSQRMEAPNQFWDFADSYCREVTVDDLDALDKTIDEFRVLSDSTFKVPPLGKHFSETAGSSADAAAKFRSRDTRESKNADVCGPLTQRLVSALMEDRVAVYNNQPNGGGGAREENGDGFLINRPGLVRALGLDGAAGSGSPVPLESRLKQVLLEQGLLLGDDAEDQAAANPDDEIMEEIKRTFATLRKLHRYNVGKLEKLSESARHEYKRNCHKKELEKADKEVIDAYRAIAACRIKRKPLTLKEKNAAAKALQNRQAALDKLSSVGTEDLTLTFSSTPLVTQNSMVMDQG